MEIPDPMSIEKSNIPRVLIADDSPTVTGILGYILGEQGWQVDTAADGVEALRRFYANPPDLVLLDIEMPRMNGYQVCRVLKEDPEMRQIPVVILTSRDLQSDRFRGTAAGADAYIVKNLEDDQILETIRDFFNQRSAAEAIRPKARLLTESEILQSVNQILDRKLFISTVTTKVEEINCNISDYRLARREVVALLSSVFEFVIGGIALYRNGRLDSTISLLNSHSTVSFDSFRKTIEMKWQELSGNPADLGGDLDEVNHENTGSRQFPNVENLVDQKFWLLNSGGKAFGIVGIAGTSALKFDQEGSELLAHFLRRTEIVLDNARLLKEMDRTNLELSDALDTLKRTQAQLIQTEKMASLGQLMAGLAHEMNNPLNFVSGNIDYVDKYSDSLLKIINSMKIKLANDKEIANYLKEMDYDFIKDDMPNMISDMKSGIYRSQEIISDLRTFASPDQLVTTPTDLRPIIDSTLNLLKHQWSGEITIQRDYQTNSAVECHSGQIGQVVLNLLTNAISSIKEANRESGNIEISLQQKEGRVELSIADNGTGIETENLSKLFQPFFTTKEVGRGMGLGLSISYGIVKQHRGDILVESQLGVGSRFVVRLPAADRQTEPLIINREE